jgi:hypothetical protein
MFGDTRLEAEAVQLAAIRARSPEARLREALELSELVHAAAMARLRARYPDRSVVELALMSTSVPVGRDSGS